MSFLQIKPKRMGRQQAWSFIPESLLRRDINLSIKIALRTCFRILFEVQPEIFLMQCAQEFLGCLEQIFDFSAKTGLVITIDYRNKSRQIIYSYRGTCSAWVLSGPLWNELPYIPWTGYPYYGGTPQPRQFQYPRPVAPQAPPPTYIAVVNQQRMVQHSCDKCIKNKKDAKSSGYAAEFKAGYLDNYKATKADHAKSKGVKTELPTSIDKPPKRQTPIVWPAVQPNRSARCENWPEITQDFWPTRWDGVRKLISKHGPCNTWYASSLEPAPPASALPTPSFVLRQRALSAASTASTVGSDSTMSSTDESDTSTVATTVTASTTPTVESDSNMSSTDESDTSTDLTSECSSSDLYDE